MQAGSAGQGQVCRSEERGARFTFKPSCKPTGLVSLSWLGKVKCLCNGIFIFYVLYTDEEK